MKCSEYPEKILNESGLHVSAVDGDKNSTSYAVIGKTDSFRLVVNYKPMKYEIEIFPIDESKDIITYIFDDFKEACKSFKMLFEYREFCILPVIKNLNDMI